MVHALIDRLVKPSTRAFWREARARKGGSLTEALHGWAYMRWPRQYISLGLGRTPAARALGEPAAAVARFFGLWSLEGAVRFADSYHGKVLPPEQARRLISVRR